MEAPELKPCPFCGEADQETLMGEHMLGTILHPAYRVRCDNCGASTGYTDRGDHIEAWNTRAHDPDLDAYTGAVLELAANTCGKNNGPWLSDAWGCREAILRLRPYALTALDRAKREARVEALEQAAEAVDRIGPRVTGDAIRSLISANSRTQ